MTGPPKGSSNAKTHGMYAMRDSGPSKLQDPAQINRLAELRLMVKTEPGRQDIREELTARMALIVDLAFAHLTKQQDQGVDIFSTDVSKRLQGYVAETRRLLDSFNPKGNMTGMQAEHEHIEKVLDNVAREKHREDES